MASVCHPNVEHGVPGVLGMPIHHALRISVFKPLDRELHGWEHPSSIGALKGTFLNKSLELDVLLSRIHCQVHFYILV